MLVFNMDACTYNLAAYSDLLMGITNHNRLRVGILSCFRVLESTTNPFVPSIKNASLL